ncbi:MAG: S41 family peptidase [Phycisphaerales bacterium]|nr:S41 family peptidase [Planctomycetota bacterium]MCH8507325.1 S41 family peptidase [Phycisphaerales bacterium]
MPRASRSLIVILGIAVIGSTIAVATNAARDPYSFFDPIVEVRMLIREHFVEEVDDRQMLHGAIEGMIGVLGDDYTEFVPAEDTAEFAKSLTGEYVGIGAEVGMRDGWFTIITPLDDSPAWRAGVMADDRVIAIDGESTEGLTVTTCIDKLMGEPGTDVTITVVRAGAETLDITITRQPIRVRPVRGLFRADAGEGEWRFILDPEHAIAYVRLSQFTPRSGQEVRRAIETATEQAGGTLGALILDLRFNPGGVMEQAVEVADLFLSEGVIVSSKGRTGRNRVERARRSGTLPDFPMVVLVNAQSASASEIVSGTLGEHDRAVVLGTRTFGKGLVQTVRPLASGAGVLKMTEQRYALPSGRIIQRTDDTATWGVDPTPGYYLPLTDDQTRAMLAARREQEIIAQRETPQPTTTESILERLRDPQLEAAHRVLLHHAATGRMEPVDIPEGGPERVASGELDTIRRHRDRILRELTRVDRRLEAAESAVGDDTRPRERVLWPEEADVVGGTVVVTDAEGNTIATLIVDNPDLHRWLVDAGVRKADADAGSD